MIFLDLIEIKVFLLWKDIVQEKWVEFYLYLIMSIMDVVIFIDKYVKIVVEWGYMVIVVIDYGGV